MKFLYDLFPLILFFASYKLYDIFVATGVAIAASAVQISVMWLKTRRFERMHVITLVLLVVFGGLTIALRDPLFIKWKTTIVNWVLAAVFLYTHYGTKRTAFEMVGGSKIALPKEVWRAMNFQWALFFMFVGALNIYVAFYYGLEMSEARREEIWVNFKVFGVLGMTFVFILIQMVLIGRKLNASGQSITQDDQNE